MERIVLEKEESFTNVDGKNQLYTPKQIYVESSRRQGGLNISKATA
jgi:hypothetical protein